MLLNSYIKFRFLKIGENFNIVIIFIKAFYSLYLLLLFQYNKFALALYIYSFKRFYEKFYIFINSQIFILIYIDNFLVINRFKDNDKVNKLINNLKKRYKICEDIFKWFLGIRVI